MGLADWEVRRDKTGATVLYSKQEGYQNSGISIHLNKGKRTLDISGWFDTAVGIPGAGISMEELEGLFAKAKRKGGVL